MDRKTLEHLVDSGRRAATARNEQPWEFIVVTDEDRRRELAALCDHGRFIAEAPACIVVVCRDTKYYLEDGSAAAENILVAAAAQGVQTCWVAGDKKPYAGRILKLLGVPDGHKLVCSIAVGYAAHPEAPTPKRKLEEVLHWERF